MAASTSPPEQEIAQQGDIFPPGELVSAMWAMRSREDNGCVLLGKAQDHHIEKRANDRAEEKGKDCHECRHIS